MGCTFKARLNQLWSIWYTVIVVTIQAYLIYLGFERYKLYTEMKWPAHGGYPTVWLNVYVILYLVCIPGSLLFFAFGFFKSGNIPGDNEKLADREERIVEVSPDKHGEKRGCFHALKSFWQHCPPIPQQLHVIMALCQVIAQQLMIAQLYRNGFINSGDFLNTELDFAYQRARQLATNLPIGETRMQGFSITSDKLSSSPLAPNLLPILMHFRLFGIPLEFVNLVVSLIAYSCAYPSVFWRLSKPFSLIFSFHLFLYSIQIVYSYISFSILFRVQETNHHSVRPVGLGQYLIHSRHLPFFHPYSILGTFLASTVLTSFAPPALYAYGYCKYYINLHNHHAKNNVRHGQSDYTDYSRRRQGSRGGPSSQLCCDGYCPHVSAILLLIMIVVVKAPTIYALLIFYQHEEKAILLSCVIVDVFYLFTWIILWLCLTVKRDWKFNVAHKVHHIYALQKGLTSGHVKPNENPSNLKNALIVMHKDHMFVTDDQTAKQSLLRAVQRGDFSTEDGGNYWQKTNGQQSPSIRKVPVEEQLRQTPEMSRLLAGRRPSDDNSQVSRSAHMGPTQQSVHVQFRGNSSPPEGQNTFGTLQRNQQTGNYYSTTLQRSQPGSSTLQRTAVNQWPTQQEAYASIHKQKTEGMFSQRRGSQDEGVAYGQIPNNYGSAYGTYARMPPQSRIPVQPGNVQQIPGTMRVNGSNYGVQQATSGIMQHQRRPSDGQGQISAVRQSPLLGQDNRLTNREQSPYQRTAGVKMSSFNSTDKNGVYGSVPSQWASQRAPPGQPQQLLWNQNKTSTGSGAGTMSASSSQQDNQCFTPTSTLTSQGSVSNYSSQHTPTPGSPNTNNSVYGTTRQQPLYGTIGGEDMYGDRTLQKTRPSAVVATGTTGVRHAVKVVPPRTDDSANFSIASSSGSQDQTRTTATANEFATSIV